MFFKYSNRGCQHHDELVLKHFSHSPKETYSHVGSSLPTTSHPTLLLGWAVLSRSVRSNSLWPYVLQPTRLICRWDFPEKNTGVGVHFLLRGIFPTQGLNFRSQRLLHWQVVSSLLSHLRSPLLISSYEHIGLAKRFVWVFP